MNKTVDKIKPAANRKTLIFLSFLMWVAVGTMLLLYAYSWLNTSHANSSFIFIGAGVGLALVIHHFGFLKIVDKNLGRILPMQGKKCVFSIMPWKSYILIIIMIVMGLLLRHSPIPKLYLAVLYTGIGTALILSSVRYLRYLILTIKGKPVR